MEELGGTGISPDDIIGNLSMGAKTDGGDHQVDHERFRIIIFDEPTTSLSNKEKEKIV